MLNHYLEDNFDNDCLINIGKVIHFDSEIFSDIVLFAGLDPEFDFRFSDLSGLILEVVICVDLILLVPTCGAHSG